jgi:hypothetical protein
VAQAKGFGGVLALVLLGFAIRGGADQPMMAGKTSGNGANDRVLMQPFASAVGGADTRASDKASVAISKSALGGLSSVRLTGKQSYGISAFVVPGRRLRYSAYCTLECVGEVGAFP